MKAVRYVDTRSGEEYEQPAGLVMLGAYVFNNVLLMLTAGIGEQYDPATGKGAVGKNYCYQVSGNSVTVFFEDKEINPFMAAGLARHDHRRFQRRQFRPRRARLLRRRLDSGRHHQRPPDRDAAGAARHAALGPRMEEGDGEMVQPRLQHRRVGLQLRAPRELSRSRSDLQGRARPAADPHDAINFHDNDYKLAEYIGGVLGRIARGDEPDRR